MLISVIIGIIWFSGMEYFRGRPSTSSTVSFVLSFVNPIVAIMIITLHSLSDFWTFYGRFSLLYLDFSGF